MKTIFMFHLDKINKIQILSFEQCCEKVKLIKKNSNKGGVLTTVLVDRWFGICSLTFYIKFESNC